MRGGVGKRFRGLNSMTSVNGLSFSSLAVHCIFFKASPRGVYSTYLEHSVLPRYVKYDVETRFLD